MGRRAPKIRCTAFASNGSPCRAWARQGTDPPRCAAHAKDAKVGAPPGNRNARKHGFYAKMSKPPQTIEEIIEDLALKQALLSDYIDACLSKKPDIDEAARLFALHGQNASRLGRLLRDRRALSGDAADGIAEAIAAALDELKTELGIDI